MSGGRIRSIKPEILEDEKAAGLTDRAWRIFVSLFTLSDDYGNLRGQERRLSGAILWAHGLPDISRELDDLEDAGMIMRYSVDGESFIHIVNWSKHQKVDRPGKRRIPGPEGEEECEHREPVTYIARRGEDGPIKIGFSVDPESRCEQLSKQQPERVSVLATIPGRKHEKALHRKFSHLRIDETEWFRPHEDLLGFVAELSNARPMPVQCPSTTSKSSRVRADAGPPPGPDPDPLPEGVQGEPVAAPTDEDRTTVCPLNLLETFPAFDELAKHYGVSVAGLRLAAKEFHDYWTVGGGSGRRKKLWARALREDLRKKHERGELRSFEQRANGGAGPRPTGLDAVAEIRRRRAGG